MSCINFRYYLNNIEIFEPFGFDGSNMKIEQKEQNFARDVYLFNEDVEISFYKNEFTGNLSHGFDIIKNALNTLGADAFLSFKIEQGNTSLYLGRLDLENLKTDGKTYYKAKLIDEGGRFVFKRDFETKKTITSTPLKVLLKAKPVEKNSKWKTNGDITYNLTGFGNFYNPFIVLEKADIKNSLIPFQDLVIWDGTGNDIITGSFKYLYATTPLTNIKISIKTNVKITVTENTYPNTISFYLRTNLIDGNNNETFADNIFYNLIPQGGGVFNYVIDEIYEYSEIAQGLYLELKFISNMIGDSNYIVEFTNSELNIIATATAINSVIETHRWIDLMQETSNLPVVAPDFQNNGEFYNTVLTNGYGIRSIKGKDFTTTAKDIYDIGFLAMDYQINNSNIQVAKYEDFYPDNQLILIDELVSESVEITKNKRFRLTDLKFGFTNYEQDRQEQNTLDQVHTYSEWKMPNAYTQGKFERTTDIIFDVYNIESARQLGFEDRTKNSSLENDDDLFGIAITPIGEENTQIYKGLFAQLTSGNTMKLLTNSFSWYSTGIEIGDTISLTGSNAGNYTVDSINEIGNIITLIGVNNGNNVEETLTITYTLNNVLWKSQTIEGFTSITGISNPTNYGNLLFQQKRIINRWLNYLASAKIYYTDLIKQTFFKSNNKLVVDGISDQTDFNTETAILSDNIAEIYCKTSFENAIFISEKMTQRNNDGTIGGYVIIDEYYGYIRDFQYIFSTGTLKVTLELLYDNYNFLLKENGEYLLTENNLRIII